LLAAYLMFGLVLIAMSRLPQLTTPVLNLDGDEAIVALMAKHVSEGQSLPVFFQGQCYGLSLLEVATGSLLFQYFGASAITLKAAMLLLWGLGWIFFVLAINTFTDFTNTCIAGCLLILCPAWSVWSLMARGGYVTAFLFTNLSLFIFSCLYQDNAPKVGLFAMLGMCLGFLFLAQPIAFLAFCPFVVVLVYRHWRISTVLVLSSSISATIALIFGATAGELSCYWSSNLFYNAHTLQALRLLPERTWVFLSGIYYFSEHEVRRGDFTILAAWLWWFLVILLFGRTIQVSIKNKPHEVTFACFISIVLVMAFTLAIGSFGYRYLLPLPGVLLFFFIVESARLRSFSPLSKIAITVFISVMIVSGAISLFEAGNYSRSWEITYDSANVEAEDELIRDLLANEIKYVYCLHPMFQWNLMWGSREKIIARWLHPTDRYPEYPRMVDRALFSGKKVAIVGTAAQLHQVERIVARHWPRGVPYKTVAGRYFWISEPSAQLLMRLGFRLNNPRELSGLHGKSFPYSGLSEMTQAVKCGSV
jgi:hypothetical protein